MGYSKNEGFRTIQSGPQVYTDLLTLVTGHMWLQLRGYDQVNKLNKKCEDESRLCCVVSQLIQYVFRA